MSGFDPPGGAGIWGPLRSILSDLENFLRRLRFSLPNPSDGPVYVVDYQNAAVDQIQNIATSPQFTAFPPANAANDPFTKPNAVCLSIWDGCLYVTDWGAAAVYKYNSPRDITNGVAPAAVWGGGGPGAGATKFAEPSAVVVDKFFNKIVADAGNNRIMWIDNNNNWTPLYGPPGSSQSAPYFSYPSGVALDNSGAIIVADTNNGRLVRIANFTSGNPTYTPCAGPPNGGDNFQYPGQVSVGLNDAIYVCDWHSSQPTLGGNQTQGPKGARLIMISDISGAGWTYAKLGNQAYGIAAGASLLYVTVQPATILMLNGIGDPNPTSYQVTGNPLLLGISVPVYL